MATKACYLICISNKAFEAITPTFIIIMLAGSVKLGHREFSCDLSARSLKPRLSPLLPWVNRPCNCSSLAWSLWSTTQSPIQPAGWLRRGKGLIMRPPAQPGQLVNFSIPEYKDFAHRIGPALNRTVGHLAGRIQELSLLYINWLLAIERA